jgi:hypothetical protein
MPWIDNTKPQTPVFNAAVISKNARSKDIILHFSPNRSSTIKQYAFYISPNKDDATKGTIYKLLPAEKDLYLNIIAGTIPTEWKNFYISITSVSITNNESENAKVYNLSFSGDRWILK